MPKPRPTPDLQYVLHPATDESYRHFDGHALAPFVAGATFVTRANAWWLAEAALLSYWAPDAAIARFARANLDTEVVEAGDTLAYVAVAPEAVLVAFRGTESDRWGDLFDDARFALVPWSHGLVHRGFKGALDRVWPALSQKLASLSSSRAIWFTGHSLGAALATLAADRFEGTTGVCAIASPRVGDRLFAASFDSRFGPRAARYVNDVDIVTHVPPPLPLPYAHVGQLRYITPEGQVTGQLPAIANVVHDVFGDPGHVLDVIHGLQAGVIRRAPDFLLDHMPRAYAVDIWNDWEAHGREG